MRRTTKNKILDKIILGGLIAGIFLLAIALISGWT